MTAIKLDGEGLAAEIKADLRTRIEALAERGITPGLATVLVGDDGPSSNYVAMKHRDSAELGMASFDERLPATATQAEVDAVVDKLNDNLARRQRSFERTSSHFARWPEYFELPRLTEGVETGWHMFPLIIREESGFRRSAFQQWMERQGVDTRMVWTGNAARQPAFRDRRFRQPADGLPNADRVMEWGVVLPNSHSLDDDDCDYIGECAEGFLRSEGLMD